MLNALNKRMQNIRETDQMGVEKDGEKRSLLKSIKERKTNCCKICQDETVLIYRRTSIALGV